MPKCLNAICRDTTLPIKQENTPSTRLSLLSRTGWLAWLGSSSESSTTSPGYARVQRTMLVLAGVVRWSSWCPLARLASRARGCWPQRRTISSSPIRSISRDLMLAETNAESRKTANSNTPTLLTYCLGWCLLLQTSIMLIYSLVSALIVQLFELCLLLSRTTGHGMAINSDIRARAENISGSYGVR